MPHLSREAFSQRYRDELDREDFTSPAGVEFGYDWDGNERTVSSTSDNIPLAEDIGGYRRT